MKKSMFKIKNIFLISTIVILLDQISKIFVLKNLNEGITLNLIPYLLDLRYIENTGAAFSIFSQQTTLLSLLSIIVSIGLIIWIIIKKSFTYLLGLTIGLLLGGTIGNGIDRIRLGFVIDFLEIIPFDFPIFNLADLAISTSVFFIILDSLKSKKQLK
tara:strand:+ start:2050 stop:2523 length:474 start_codon:yes stop_codon:yes gene_type:complete